MQRHKKLSTKDAESILETVSARVQCVKHDGGSLWVKTIKQSKRKIGHRFQRLLSQMVPLGMLRVTVSAGGIEALKAEVGRLEAFRVNGINVPEVLYHTDTQFIMTDTGLTLAKIFADEPNNPDHFKKMEEATLMLAELHGKGLFHGRPYMKDFVYNSEIELMGLIDLEEDPLQVMTSAEAQARDVWLFLSSLSSLMPNDPEKLLSYFNLYQSQAPVGFEKPLREFVRFLRPLSWFLTHTLGNKLGRDVMQATQATNALHDYFKNQPK